jgi:putative ABC transport system ATP-binding protein
VFEIRQLSKIYGTGKVRVIALDSVSFTIPDGDMMAIMGRSGSGKSTLLRQLGLLDKPTIGTVMLDKREVSRLPEFERAKLRLRYLGYVFQEYALLGELTAHQNVYLPGMMLGTKGNHYKERAKELLALVGLEQRAHHYPKELSGGEQQRVAIARALINSPRVLLADEPCANLDTISSRLVMQTLVKLNQEMNVTVVFVSHDPADKSYARRTIYLSDGKMAGEEAVRA